MNKIITFLLSLAILVLAPSFVMASDSFPSFPMSFYGTASLNGSPLQAGSKIQAYSDSTLVGEVILDEVGVYGYTDPMKSKLIIGSFTGELTFMYVVGSSTPSTGCLVNKYADGFVVGNSISKNLVFNNTSCETSTTVVVPKPSTNSSGGGGGGGSAQIANCTSITYTDWGTCENDFQNRSLLTSSPNGCLLTETQRIAMKRSCQIATTTLENANTTKVLGVKIENKIEEIKKNNDVDDKQIAKKIIAEEKLLVRKDVKIINKLKGKILIQVENKGQAWYVNPDSGKKYFLGRPADAFGVMRSQGLGVKNNVIKNTKIYPSKLLGKILINVEDKGKAYYINPKDKKAYSLGRPADAFNLMKKLGLGINNENIRKIEVGD